MKSFCRVGLIMMAVMCVFGAHSFAQNVTNITATQVGNMIHVRFDLDEESDVFLYVSTDGGKTFGEPLKQVSGDVGEHISPGHKIIVWDVLAELENLEGDEIVFQVEAPGLDKQNLSFTVNGVTFKMIYVKGGTFTMGSNSGDSKPEHEVTLSEFWMGETEVTQALWKEVMGVSIREQRPDPEYQLVGEGSNYPIYYLHFNHALAFCDKLNKKLSDQLPSGYRFSLPTEAQWEYSARGGHKSKGFEYSGSNDVEEVAWCIKNGKGVTHPVKTKAANELGLYDMSGNVWEWCLDWSGKYSSDPQTNPTGPSSGSKHIIRGGGYFYASGYCKVVYRAKVDPLHRGWDQGLRIALVHE